MSFPKMKAFINPSQVALADDFNKWSESEWENLPEGHDLIILNSDMLFSPALQKFVLAVMYSSKPPN